MNGRKLFTTIFAGEIPNRLPVQGLWPWTETVIRWQSEGLEVGRDPDKALGLIDHDTMALPLDLNMLPVFPIQVIAEDDRFVTLTDEYGITKKMFRHDFEATRGQMKEAGLTSAMSLWIDFPVKDMQSWKRTLADHFQPLLAQRLPADWSNRAVDFVEKSKTHWITFTCFPLFGLFGPLRQLMGFEPLILAMAGDNPSLVDLIIEDLTSFWLQVFDQVLGRVRLDEVVFFEDMASTQAPLISPAMFRRFMAPGYRKVIGGLREMGIQQFTIDSDGDIRRLIPEFLACGLTGILPIQVNANMDIEALRREYPTLNLNGGIDKRALAKGPEAIDAELTRWFSVAWKTGRCLPRIDHGAPPDISWSNVRYFARQYLDLCNKKPGDVPATH
jgi:hypothetical protein